MYPEEEITSSGLDGKKRLVPSLVVILDMIASTCSFVQANVEGMRKICNKFDKKLGMRKQRTLITPVLARTKEVMFQLGREKDAVADIAELTELNKEAAAQAFRSERELAQEGSDASDDHEKGLALLMDVHLFHRGIDQPRVGTPPEPPAVTCAISRSSSEPLCVQTTSSLSSGNTRGPSKHGRKVHFEWTKRAEAEGPTTPSVAALAEGGESKTLAAPTCKAAREFRQGAEMAAQRVEEAQENKQRSLSNELRPKPEKSPVSCGSIFFKSKQTRPSRKALSRNSSNSTLPPTSRTSTIPDPHPPPSLQNNPLPVPPAKSSRSLSSGFSKKSVMRLGGKTLKEQMLPEIITPPKMTSPKLISPPKMSPVSLRCSQNHQMSAMLEKMDDEQIKLVLEAQCNQPELGPAYL
eukprot:gb/GEZN01001690.1/.p1 GENE.gb/GEZN01001690.1/~~gb/GEZN01001690.1/.p1  ORF type:complete len:409 (+),score=57.08 gb/GEZN01001690.1/:500-1726(+)